MNAEGFVLPALNNNDLQWLVDVAGAGDAGLVASLLGVGGNGGNGNSNGSNNTTPNLLSNNNNASYNGRAAVPAVKRSNTTSSHYSGGNNEKSQTPAPEGGGAIRPCRRHSALPDMISRGAALALLQQEQKPSASWGVRETYNNMNLGSNKTSSNSNLLAPTNNSSSGSIGNLNKKQGSMNTINVNMNVTMSGVNPANVRNYPYSSNHLSNYASTPLMPITSASTMPLWQPDMTNNVMNGMSPYPTLSSLPGKGGVNDLHASNPSLNSIANPNTVSTGSPTTYFPRRRHSAISVPTRGNGLSRTPYENEKERGGELSNINDNKPGLSGFGCQSIDEFLEFPTPPLDLNSSSMGIHRVISLSQQQTQPGQRSTSSSHINRYPHGNNLQPIGIPAQNQSITPMFGDDALYPSYGRLPPTTSHAEKRRNSGLPDLMSCMSSSLPTSKTQCLPNVSGIENFEFELPESLLGTFAGLSVDPAEQMEGIDRSDSQMDFQPGGYAPPLDSLFLNDQNFHDNIFSTSMEFNPRQASANDMAGFNYLTRPTQVKTEKEDNLGSNKETLNHTGAMQKGGTKKKSKAKGEGDGKNNEKDGADDPNGLTTDMHDTKAKVGSSGKVGGDGSKCKGDQRSGSECANCKTTLTTLWRRCENGMLVCNACGLYERLHKCPRPTSISHLNTVIRKRNRKKRNQKDPVEGMPDPSEIYTTVWGPTKGA